MLPSRLPDTIARIVRVDRPVRADSSACVTLCASRYDFNLPPALVSYIGVSGVVLRVSMYQILPAGAACVCLISPDFMRASPSVVRISIAISTSRSACVAVVLSDFAMSA